MKLVTFLKLNFFDLIVECIGILILICIWLLVILNINVLPKTIPVHFNGLGEVDKIGSKTNLWSLPIIATVLYIFISFLSKFPNILIENNFEKEKNFDDIRLKQILKLNLIIIFGIIIHQTIQISLKK